jgi:hypothetical protein
MKFSIAEETAEAERISKLEAVCILISIAFGVGYINVVQNNHTDPNYLPYELLINFMFGIISCYMLSEAKKAHSNKLGSYHEIAFYYFKDRTVIYVICFQYGVTLLYLSSYALQFISGSVTEFLIKDDYSEFNRDTAKYKITKLVLILVIGAVIYPQSVKLNY